MPLEDVKHYGLAQWHWDGSAHVPPEGATSVIDYRPLEDQATAGQSQGYGFFHWSTQRPVGAIDLGSGDCRTLQPTQQQRTELRTRLGLSADPAGATLIETMEDCLTGIGMPIMPGRDGEEAIHLAGHSKVWSRRVVGAEVMAASPKGRANRQRDLIRAAIDEADRTGGKKLAQKVLGACLLKLGLTRQEIAEGAPAKAAQWRRLLSASLRAKHGDARPERPTTRFSESWPATKASIDGATGLDQSWSVLALSAWRAGLQSASNECWPTSTETSLTAYRFGRCTSAVSSADHWVNLTTWHAETNSQAGPAVRMAVGAETCYFGAYRYNGENRLWKYVAGVLTFLGVAEVSNLTQVRTHVLDADGSTIAYTINGVAPVSVTDTAIPSGLHGGFQVQNYFGKHATARAWSIDDGLVPAPGAAACKSSAGLSLGLGM